MLLGSQDISNGRKDYHPSNWHLILSDFGMQEMIEDTLMACRLRWLGHLGHMSQDRLPKHLLFGELENTRPCHGTKKRWRDGVSADLKAIGVSDSWYDMTQDRCLTCSDRIKEREESSTECAANRTTPKLLVPCSRVFHRKGDLTRHSCFCACTL